MDQYAMKLRQEAYFLHARPPAPATELDYGILSVAQNVCPMQ